MKYCSHCQQTKPFTDFWFNKTNNCYISKCKECKKALNRQYSKMNKEKISVNKSRYYQENKAILDLKSKAWIEQNRDRRLSHISKYDSKIRSTVLGKINHRMSAALRMSLKTGKNGNSWELLVGYTASDLKNHLEGLFKLGMSWDNFGEWHIDHIIPKSWFVYSSTEDDAFKKCWGLDNLQPLWAIENLKKHNSFIG